MDKTTWVPCRWFNNYEVSECGKIRFVGGSPQKKVKHLRALPEYGTIIKNYTTDGGRYLSISLITNEFNPKKVTRKVHILVFFSFNKHLDPIDFHEVDHIDGNSFNCHKNNLQYITHSKNISKCFDKSKTTSKYTGVYWSRGERKWKAMIRFKNKRYCLGTFDIEKDAGDAYTNAYHSLHASAGISVQS